MKMLSVLAEPFTRYQGDIYLTDRTLQSLAETTKHMELLVTSSQGVQEYEGSILPHNLDKINNYLPSSDVYSELATPELIKKVTPDIISTLATSRVRWLEEQSVPVVYSVENTSKTRLDIYYSQSNLSFLDKARIYVGEIKHEKRFKQTIRKAAGIEINGDGAYTHYGRINPHTIRYYDHRIYQHDLDNIQLPKHPKNGSALTVAFSGRWIAIKGTDLFLEIAAQTYALNPDIQFVIMGDGEYRDLVQEYRYPNLQNLGFIKFDPEWKKYVRDYVDIMLLPHRQGDPSCTYFESLGMGVPVVGFSNDTLTPLVERGVGWEFSRFDVSAVAQKIVELNRDYAQVTQRALQAHKFMSDKSFEKTNRMRAEHMMNVVRR